MQDNYRGVKGDFLHDVFKYIIIELDNFAKQNTKDLPSFYYYKTCQEKLTEKNIEDMDDLFKSTGIITRYSEERNLLNFILKNPPSFILNIPIGSKAYLDGLIKRNEFLSNIKTNINTLYEKEIYEILLEKEVIQIKKILNDILQHFLIYKSPFNVGSYEDFRFVKLLVKILNDYGWKTNIIEHKPQPNMKTFQTIVTV